MFRQSVWLDEALYLPSAVALPLQMAEEECLPEVAYNDVIVEGR